MVKIGVNLRKLSQNVIRKYVFGAFVRKLLSCIILEL